MLGDCKHRDGHRCIKLNKNVAIDMRDPDNPRCWEQPKNSLIEGCENYEI